MPLMEAVMWLACRFEEEERHDRFQAAVHGAEMKKSKGGHPPKKAGLRDMMGMLQNASRGQTGIGVERVKVSPEELARRRQMNNDK